MKYNNESTNNPIDTAINYMFPGWGLQRKEARLKANIVGKSMKSAFDAASTANAAFEGFITSLSDVNNDMLYELDKLVSRTRDLVRNNSTAKAIPDRICDHSIGERGLICQPSIDHEFLGQSKEWAIAKQKEFKRIWEEFAHNQDNDFYRDQSPQEIGYSALKSELEGGDAFVVLPSLKRSTSRFDLKVQLIEGELISNPNAEPATEKLIFGVGRDNRGIPIKYHIANQIQNDLISFGAQEWTAVNIRDKFGRLNVLHIWDKLRPSQLRGIPILTSVIEKLLQAEKLSRAELLASVLNAYYTMVFIGDTGKTKITNRNPNRNASNTDTSQKYKLGSGTSIQVPKGTEVKSFDPSRPNKDLKPYLDSIYGEIGAAIGVAKSFILIWYDRSYSASTGEVLASYATFRKHGRKTANRYYQPLYERVIEEAVAKGMLDAPGFFVDQSVRHAFLGNVNQWILPKMPSFDVLKEARAKDVGIKNKSISLQETTTERNGQDWNNDVYPSVQDESKKIKELDSNEDD